MDELWRQEGALFVDAYLVPEKKNNMQIDHARFIGLLVLLTVAVFTDIRTRKVPNSVVLCGALAGMVTSLLPGSIGIFQSLGGVGIGLVLLLPLYALRAMGAGDVKLMACAGAFLGIQATLLATLFAFAAGGVLAILYSAHAGILRQMLSNLLTFIFHSIVRLSGRSLPNVGDMPVSGGRMPYSLAIAGGVGVYVAERFYSTGVFG